MQSIILCQVLKRNDYIHYEIVYNLEKAVEYYKNLYGDANVEPPIEYALPFNCYALKNKNKIILFVDSDGNELKLIDADGKPGLFSECHYRVYMLEKANTNQYDTFREEMTLFAQGHWTRDKPTISGHYPIANKTFGYEGDEIIVYKDKNYEIKYNKNWSGYYWSVPFPNFPMVPNQIDDL
jgi:hypothetical protein